MLKGIPAILSPELLKVMMEMGHGDEITIGDGNYPAAATAKRLIRLDGHGVCEILDAMLKFLPLDTYVDEPVLLMQTTPGDNADTSIWNDYRAIVEKHQPGTKVGFRRHRRNCRVCKHYSQKGRCKVNQMRPSDV